MRLLAVDTTTEACSAALWQDGRTLARYEVVVRGHTARLPAMVNELMQESGTAFAQLDALVCAVGPGSFAGLRIGIGFIKGLALALDRPVLGIGSLAMLAQGALDRAGATQVLAAIDARMNEVYFGAYERDDDGLARPIGADCVAAPDAVRIDDARNWTAVGSGWGAYAAALRAGIAGSIVHTDAQALPRAEDALRLALPQLRAGLLDTADALAPVYLRDKVALTLDEQQRQRQQRNEGRT